MMASKATQGWKVYPPSCHYMATIYDINHPVVHKRFALLECLRGTHFLGKGRGLLRMGYPPSYSEVSQTYSSRKYVNMNASKGDDGSPLNQRTHALPRRNTRNRIALA